MCFCYILLHFTSRFAAFYLAFWCKMQGVLVLNALQNLAICPHFFVVADANLGEFFFKEKSESIVNGQKRRG